MALQYNLTVWWLIVAGLTSVGLALYAWRRSQAVWAIAYAAMMGSAAWWTLTYTMRLTSADLAPKLLWDNIQVTISSTISVSWLVFVLLFTNRGHWVTRTSLWLLMVVPLMTILAAWTNGWHFLYQPTATVEQVGLFQVMKFEQGPLLWLQLIYSYILVAIGIGLLAEASIRWPQPYRGQAFVLFIAGLTPLLANIVTNFDLLPFLPPIDLTPFSFNLTGLLMAWGLFRFNMLKIVPVARGAIFESIGDGVIVLDTQNRIVDINPAAERILDQPASILIGQAAAEALSKWPHLIERFRDVVEVNEEVSVGTAEGRAIFDLRISPLTGRTGQLSGRLVMLHDITERKWAELELQYAKEAAQEAWQVAEEASTAKSDFLANVSHELRTPLTSILGFAKIIHKRLDERIFPVIETEERKVQRAVKQVGTNLNIILAEGQRLTTLINNVLDLEKIEAGKMEWHMDQVNLVHIIEQAAAATATLFDHKRLKLSKDIPFDLPDLLGDKDKLIQVLINLISNAVKFTEQGSVTCRVRRMNGRVAVSIIDTGVGIAEADLEQIFERFKQVGDTLTDKPTGTGLGLSICKHIVEHHGGQIWVESEPGRGSTFTFTLPVETTLSSGQTDAWLKTLNIEMLVKQLEAHGVTATDLPPAGERTVLVVDDDDHIREMLRQELEAKGYRVQEAKNGVDAIAQVKVTRPDLIMLDVMMPQISGFDVAAILKNNPHTADIPIIILSVVEDKIRGYRLGVDRYLTKPVDPQDLLAEVNVLISRGTSKRKVLVVDEDRSAAKTLLEVLQLQGYSVTEATNSSELIETATTIRPDMIIINALVTEQHQEIVKTLRFEKGLENVLLFFFQDPPATEQINS